MSYMYKVYDRRFAAAARRADEAAEAARNAAAARREAKRLELQPEYEAANAWHSEQMKAHGLSSQLQAEFDRRLAELDARVQQA